jgi:hypothetical protein
MPSKAEKRPPKKTRKTGAPDVPRIDVAVPETPATIGEMEALLAFADEASNLGHEVTCARLALAGDPTLDAVSGKSEAFCAALGLLERIESRLYNLQGDIDMRHHLLLQGASDAQR